ncbi:hypothetical protein NU10_12080 [Flavobacterium dauae]|uniref:hypothetical protein n=1 Tax=Flavobacterium dauae TaxID=1563479 RepID=UPI00101D75C4|nr:hypothetical protein [Flavobacterium dauae]WLD23439.1 hypothetical protein NU10_12080 [Flavobacterium dauae]
MKYLVFLLVLISCKTVKNNLNDPSAYSDFDAEQYADYYLVIPHKSFVYSDLQNTIQTIHKQYNLEIDTIGRFFDKAKQQIIVPEDDEDELYRGEYFPRRFESETLSIENVYFYTKNAVEPKQFPTEMMVVASMFSNKSRADSLKTVLKRLYPKTRVLKSKIYIGCMH